ncbi:MAG TPA: phosphodiesterase [Clostridium sp.]|nr:phosphodiesterase [Clostridium sp.]
MINTNSINQVNKSNISGLTIPLYDSYCFSNICGTIKDLFNIDSDKKLPSDVIGNSNEKPNKIVFFLTDAFGWCFYDKYKEHSKFLCKLEKSGVVSKLTSQFPSTTTAHVTTALSGESVYEHGLYEWFYYEPKADDIVTSFLFKEARNKYNETLTRKNIKPSDFIPQKSFFKELLNHGIKSTVYQPSHINNGTYTRFTCRDANLKGYNTNEDLFKSLSKDLLKNDDKEYFYVYLHDIDAIAHAKGNQSEEFKIVMGNLFKNLDRFYEEGKDKFSNTAIIISADHGQIDIDLKNPYYINKLIPDIEKYLKKNKNNDIMSPAGYCRDLFLHVEEKYLIELKTILEKELYEIAQVYLFEDLKDKGLFGVPSEKLLERVGNLVILPKENNTVWWYEKDIFEVTFLGMHGGASKEEMEIPFLFYMFK